MFIWLRLLHHFKCKAAVEPQDEDRRGSGNLADFDAHQIPVLDGAREVIEVKTTFGNKETKPQNSLNCLMFRGVLSLAECHTLYAPHHAVIHGR